MPTATNETSWSLNSVWASSTEQLTVLFYGVHKDGATLHEILDNDSFAGTLVSDNAAVYQGFTNSQKCRAHWVRQAIKRTLQDGTNQQYRGLADVVLSDIHKPKEGIRQR